MTAFPPLSDFAEPSTHYCRKDPDWSSFDLKGVAHWVGIDSFSAPAPLVGAGIARRKTSVLLNAHRWGVARAEEIGECTGALWRRSARPPPRSSQKAGGCALGRSARKLESRRR